jgi:hypothetical protein
MACSWNTLYAEEVGVQLSLLPILVGFLTYKVALITRQGKQVRYVQPRHDRPADKPVAAPA